MSEDYVKTSTGFDDHSKLINTDNLTRIGVYLEGIKAGRGNIHPLGTDDLEALWKAIKHLRGYKGYKVI